MIDAQDAHVGAAPRPALLDHLGRRIVQGHEGDRPGRHPHGGADDVVLGSQPREREPGPAARLVHQRHVPQRVVDAALARGQRVVHRQHEAGRQLAQRPPGVHQRRAVGHPHPRRHQLVERLRHRLDGAGARAVAGIGRGDRARHAPQQIGRLFHRLTPLVLDQVSALQDRDRVLAELWLHVVASTSPAHARRVLTRHATGPTVKANRNSESCAAAWCSAAQQGRSGPVPTQVASTARRIAPALSIHITYLLSGFVPVPWRRACPT